MPRTPHPAGSGSGTEGGSASPSGEMNRDCGWNAPGRTALKPGVPTPVARLRVKGPPSLPQKNAPSSPPPPPLRPPGKSEQESRCSGPRGFERQRNVGLSVNNRSVQGGSGAAGASLCPRRRLTWTRAPHLPSPHFSPAHPAAQGEAAAVPEHLPDGPVRLVAALHAHQADGPLLQDELLLHPDGVDLRAGLRGRAGLASAPGAQGPRKHEGPGPSPRAVLPCRPCNSRSQS